MEHSFPEGGGAAANWGRRRLVAGQAGGVRNRVQQKCQLKFDPRSATGFSGSACLNVLLGGARLRSRSRSTGQTGCALNMGSIR